MPSTVPAAPRCAPMTSAVTRPTGHPLLRTAILVGCMALSMTHATPAWSAPEVDAAFAQAVNEARQVTRVGPGLVPLGQQVELDLPAGVEFIPQPQAGALLQALKQPSQSNLLGLVQPHGEGNWMVVARFDAVGPIHAKADPDWNHEALLARIRKAVDQAPVPLPYTVTRWAQRPAFEAARQRLVWAVALQPRGGTHANAATADADGERVNYNTHALGRDGVLSLNLIAPASTITQDKRLAHVLLSGVAFLPGKSLTDVGNTDAAGLRPSAITLDDLVALDLPAPSAAPAATPEAGMSSTMIAVWVAALALMAAVLARLMRRKAPVTWEETRPADH